MLSSSLECSSRVGSQVSGQATDEWISVQKYHDSEEKLVEDRDASTIWRRPPRDHLGRMSYLGPSTTPHDIYEYSLFVLTLFWLRNLTHVVHLSRLYSIHCFLCLCGKFS